MSVVRHQDGTVDLAGFVALVTVMGKLSAAALMAAPVVGPFEGKHQEMIHDLITSEWAKKWLKDFETKIEEHASTPTRRVFWCRRRANSE